MRAPSASPEVELENTGTVAWRDAIRLAYHWLDDRGNPIVWDGERTPLPARRAGRARATVEARVRAPIPPGRYRFALDLVAEHRAWFSQLGSEPVSREVEVLPRARAIPQLELPACVEPAPDWHERVAAAHAEGYAVVAGAIDWLGGLGRRRPRALAPYAPGAGPHPGLLRTRCSARRCSTASTLERLPDVAGLPAFAAPAEEPWIYDGRIVLAALRPAPRRRYELDREPVVDPAEDERAERERDDRRDREVDHVAGARGRGRARARRAPPRSAARRSSPSARPRSACGGAAARRRDRARSSRGSA